MLSRRQEGEKEYTWLQSGEKVVQKKLQAVKKSFYIEQIDRSNKKRELIEGNT